MGRHRFDFNAVLDESQKIYIKQNILTKSDRQVALMIGSDRETVRKYRSEKLGFSKVRVRKLKFIDEESKKMVALNELLALQSYDYKGIMIDSINHRIKFLQDVVNGV